MRTRSVVFGLLLALVTSGAPLSVAGQELDDVLFHFSLIDASASRTGDATIGRWESSGWIGTDYDRVWWNTSGEAADGGFHEAEAMVMYGHYARRFWDLVIGYRQDFEPTTQGYLTFGVMGLAPYWFDVALFGFISDQGKPSVRLEGENDLYLTQRLVLQVGAELNWLLTEDDELDLASGLRELRFGLRTRYEIRRKLGPYLDLTWSRDESRHTANASEVDAERFRLSVGIRLIY